MNRLPATLLAGAAAALLLSSAAIAAAAFSHEPGVDRFGYYFLPEDAPMVGDWAFDNLHIGFDFEAWERGERTESYAPVMVSFNDTSSPQGTNELGAPYYETTIRVLPTAYTVTATTLSFAGSSNEIGAVTIEAEFLPGETLRLVGDVSYGGVVLEGVEFSYFAGD